MSRVPESHGRRLAPYIAGDESVVTGCVEEAPGSDSDRSTTSVATDSRLLRLTLTPEEERVTCVPYSRVGSASFAITEREGRDRNAILAGATLTVAGLAALGFGTTVPDQQVMALAAFAGSVLALAGVAIAALGFRTEPGEVRLELTGTDGSEAYETVLPRDQADFARAVSRLVGSRAGTAEARSPAGGRTRVDPADD